VARVASVDELAAVMGHEIGHVHAHHIARQQEQTQFWNYAGLVGLLLSAVQPALGAAAVGAALSAQLKYSRDFEQEADYLGLRFMHDAGYAPDAMPSFFKKILAEQRLNPAGVPPYLLTHPLTQDRIAHVETALAAFPRAEIKPRPGPDHDLDEARAMARAESEPAEVVVSEYRRRAEAAPKDGFAHYLLGSVYASLGRLDAARDALEHARSLGGAGARLPVRLAGVYLGQGRAREARDLAASFVGAHPDDADAQAVLGRILLELGDEPGGIAALERSINLDPLADEPHRLLGLAYGRAGRTGDGYYHLAMAYELRGELPQALSQYTRARDAVGQTEPRAGTIAASIADLEEIVKRGRRQRPTR
jgi:predicted Zn-dependent protease